VRDKPKGEAGVPASLLCLRFAVVGDGTPVMDFLRLVGEGTVLN
jgi:hypothetical protein